MDSDGDGFISAENINIEYLPSEVLQVFAPVLDTLESLGVYMNLSKWVELATKHLAKESITEKNKVFNKPKPVQ